MWCKKQRTRITTFWETWDKDGVDEHFSRHIVLKDIRARKIHEPMLHIERRHEVGRSIRGQIKLRLKKPLWVQTADRAHTTIIDSAHSDSRLWGLGLLLLMLLILLLLLATWNTIHQIQRNVQSEDRLNGDILRGYDRVSCLCTSTKSESHPFQNIKMANLAVDQSWRRVRWAFRSYSSRHRH